MQHLQPNTTLQGGKYRIERVLGQGGFGITYLAVQTSLQRRVAIKEFFMKDSCSRDEATLSMLTPSTGGTKQVEQYKRKFIKEARNLARLNHPNIISVIDVFEEYDTVYYVMPYLVGGSLQDYVKSHGALSESEAMKYVKQVAKALKYMHEEQHMCHFDVKPANILLDDKSNAVLIDFGISKNYDSSGHETTTTPVGISEGYAPIEQYQQNVEEFSPVSDVYALGATLYFLLHAKQPISAPNRAGGSALMMRKSFSQGVKDIINASMKVSKRERVKSVDVFLVNSNGHKFVDLGLSVYWADMNIGASSPDEVGIGYIWGDCNGWINKETRGSFFKRLHNYKPQVDVISSNKQYDTATNMWGSCWRIPKISEFEELYTKCNWYIVDEKHIKIVGPSGNYIVLYSGPYWTGERMHSFKFGIDNNKTHISCNFFDLHNLSHLNSFCLIRPVMDKNKI